MIRWLALISVLFAPLAMAEQAQKFGNIEVHYNAMLSTDLSPDVAKNYKIDRSPTRGIVTVSVLKKNAMGVAQGAKTEAETAMKSMIDRWLADRDFVTREEFDAVRAMAQKAREENEVLKARLDAMEAAGK